MSPAAMRAHVIVNRRARLLSRPGPLLTELCRARRGVEVHETGSVEELDGVVRALMSRQHDLPPGEEPPAVVLAGGDGSYMAGVSALARASNGRSLPPIALAPGGTVGTVAQNWGMAGDPVVCARRLLDAIERGSVRSKRRQTLRVIETGGREHVGFIFGTGLVARFFEIYESRGAGGNVAAARIALRVFAGSFVGSPLARTVLDPIACSISVDGEPAPFERVSLLCASVVRDLGLKMRLTYRAGEEEARFHVVASPLGPRLLGPQMPLVLAARPLVGPRIDELASELSLRFESGRGAYVLDGDLLRADALTVTLGPALRVLG